MNWLQAGPSVRLGASSGSRHSLTLSGVSITLSRYYALLVGTGCWAWVGTGEQQQVVLSPSIRTQLSWSWGKQYGTNQASLECLTSTPGKHLPELRGSVLLRIDLGRRQYV